MQGAWSRGTQRGVWEEVESFGQGSSKNGVILLELVGPKA